jgi:ATP-dependent Lon protease
MTDEHDDTRAPAVKRARRSKKAERTKAPQASGDAEASAAGEGAAPPAANGLDEAATNGAEPSATEATSTAAPAEAASNGEAVDLSQLFAASTSGEKRRRADDDVELTGDRMIVVAVHGMVLFPGVVLPVVVGRDKSVRALQAALKAEKPVGLLLQKDASNENPAPGDLFTVGTTAAIVRYVTTPDGGHHVIVQGQKRFRVKRFVRTEPYFVCDVEQLDEDAVTPGKGRTKAERALEARTLHLKYQASEALSLLPETPEELLAAINNSSSPSALTDLVATFMELPPAEKQQILETVELGARMDLVSAKLAHLIEVLSLSKELRQKTRGTMEKAQREYFLREQLKTIQAELGEEASPELADLARAIDAAGMPEAVLKEVKKELARLQRMPEQAGEYGMLRNYLETMVELPWSKSSTDRIDLRRAKKILDEDHFGLEKVKRRILEFLAVRKLAPSGKSPILCLVGPPGVGKTSLGRSIARAMGREFVRISLGGVHDEAEIRGHRRTYVGALPGAVVQALRRAGTNNPVFMLDEMDKLGRSFQGDPSSALLEVLDPEQNKNFKDHYLGVPFDLSRVMFVATANLLEEIPGPLRDRCEVIELSSYTEEEKLEIAKRYLVARQRTENGLREKQFAIDDQALVEIVRHHTAEAGCRALERQIGAIARHCATKIASNEKRSCRIKRGDVAPILGPRRFEDERRLRTAQPGVATGLAWTPLGGDILFIETTLMPGKGEFLLTGQLGDVMKESVRAAISLVKSRAAELGITERPFEDKDLHVHFPAGAIPKDGPSAGVTVFTALVSLLTGRSVDPEVAMTGEISLRGLVLPVGGIKEKVLAAHRAGIQKVLLPMQNKKDEQEIPASARKGLEIVWIERVEQALEHALSRAKPAKHTPAVRRELAKKPVRRAARGG